MIQVLCMGIWNQVGIWGGWGGHTSYNDLVAASERWNRFYGFGGVGVRFLTEKRVQPGIYWEGGRFISQDRRIRKSSQTKWTAISVGLRVRPLRRAVSPLAEVSFFQLNATSRTLEGRVIPGSSASIAAIGVGWGGGVSWRFRPWGELSFLYLRRRPQTAQLEGIQGPARDRIEGIMGQLSLIWLSETSNSSRFR
ncbi:MAG: hypothetical protein N2170_01890 [Bacteroidia bacterium]|nr:hypothetical protein [Bacteroidia bacterium]